MTWSPDAAGLPALRHDELVVSQKVELAEAILDYEARNKYAICSSDGAPVAYAAEQGKGAWAFFMRLLLRHWRTFEVHLFSPDRRLIARASHPFRWLWFNECLLVHDAEGRYLGAIARRFSIFTKTFDVVGADGDVLLTVRSPIWKVWTFEFMGRGERRAVVEKKWSGLLKEMFTDADSFRIHFDDPSLPNDTRWLLIAAAIFIDLQYFEDNKGSSVVAALGE